jgi:pimeloyl-ACP methyl ester carboxylesterase
MAILNYIKGDIKVGEHDLRYIEFGKGDPLLILPGVGSVFLSPRNVAPYWYYFYRKYEDMFKVVVMDLKKMDSGITTEDMADSITKAMDELRYDKFLLFGNSLGGMISQHIAADNPKRVKKLLLTMTCAKPDKNLLDISDRWVGQIKDGKYMKFSDEMLRTYYKIRERNKMTYSISKYFGSFYFSAVRKTLRKEPLQRFIYQMESLKTHDTLKKIERIKCPRKVIGGAEDILFPPKIVKQLAAKLKIKPYIIDDFGHWGLGKGAEEFQKQILEFLK